MEREALFDYIKNTIDTKFRFLYPLGYSLINFEVKDYFARDEISNNKSLTIEFLNDKKRRRIWIYYAPYQSDTKQIIDNFSFAIWNKNHSHIALDNFMKLKHEEEYIQFTLKNYEGTFEEKLDKLLEYVITIMQKYLIEVLEGKKWINIPMDWGGAK